jgi:outer membrane lipoprotein carrier protein
MKPRPAGFCAAALVLVAIVVLPGGWLPAVSAAVPTARELAEALQKRYDTIRDFSADFEHVYRGGVLRKQLSERGRLLIKKPGKMRWEYSAPERKVFVSDGVKLYSFLPDDKQVIVSSVPQGQATTPALFLAGQGNLTRDFTASDIAAPKGTPPGTRALKLVPRTVQADFEALTLSLDPATLTLRGIESVDAQGGTSSFVFTNLKENVGLNDKEFVFSIPRGVDVVTDASSPSDSAVRPAR